MASGPLPPGGGVGLRLVRDTVARLGGTIRHSRTAGRTVLAAQAIAIPPLAERPEDALWLAHRLFGSQNAGRRSGLAAATEAAIRAHGWPGNGREMRARLIRAIEAAEGPLILPADLFPEPAGQPAVRSLAEVRDAGQRAHILAALDRTGGQVGEAAKRLRISRTTLWEKMQKLGRCAQAALSGFPNRGKTFGS